MKIKLILLLLISLNSFSQDSFSNGFEKGFEEGYCYEKPGCTAPSAPSAPTPTAYENNSYKDGYNRGFQTALTAKKNNTTNYGFVATKTEFIDGAMFDITRNLDMNDIREVARAIKKIKAKAFKELKDGNYYGVIKLSEQVLKINPRDTEMHFMLGKAYYNLGHKKKSLKMYKISLKRQYRKGVERLKNEVKKELINENSEKRNDNKKLRKVIKKIQNLANKSKYDKAIVLLDKEIKKSNNKLLYGLRGLVYYENGNYRQAIQDITKSAKNSNEIKTNFLSCRALAKTEVGDYYGALDDYDILINKDDIKQEKLATYYNNKAYTYVELKNYKKAQQLVNKALEVNNEIWYIWDTRAEIYLKTDKYYKAIDDATTALNIKEHENTFFIRGQAYIKINNKEKGCRDLSKSGQLGNKKAYSLIKKYCN